MQHTLASGATLDITIAPFADAHRLLKAFLKALKGTELPRELLEVDPATMKPSDFLAHPELLKLLMDRAIELCTSEEVEAALFQCFDRVLYDTHRLTRGLFDDPKYADQLKADFFAIAYYVVEANCKPFFKQTFSRLKEQAATTPATQK